MRLQSCILSVCGLLKLVAASTAESELRGLCCNTQDATALCLALAEMGHPQTKSMSIYVDNCTTVGLQIILSRGREAVQ